MRPYPSARIRLLVSSAALNSRAGRTSLATRHSAGHPDAVALEVDVFDADQAGQRFAADSFAALRRSWLRRTDGMGRPAGHLAAEPRPACARSDAALEDHPAACACGPVAHDAGGTPASRPRSPPVSARPLASCGTQPRVLTGSVQATRPRQGPWPPCGHRERPGQPTRGSWTSLSRPRCTASSSTRTTPPWPIMVGSRPEFDRCAVSRRHRSARTVAAGHVFVQNLRRGQ